MNKSKTIFDANIDLTDESAVAAAAAQLRAQADDMDARLKQLRQENDDAATRPSNAASKANGGSTLKTIKKVVGWTLGVGATAFAGVYLYGKFSGTGVEEAIDAATAAV